MVVAELMKAKAPWPLILAALFLAWRENAAQDLQQKPIVALFGTTTLIVSMLVRLKETLAFTLLAAAPLFCLSRAQRSRWTS